MTVMLDIIGAAILVGMVVIMILNVNVNMGNENFKALTELRMQTETIQLARILEYDLHKVGYKVPRAGAIRIADTSRLKFRANLFNVGSATDSVEYNLGGFVAWSKNPRDKSLYRYENTNKVYIDFSITRLKFSYYDSRDSLMATPVTGSMLDSIKSIRILLTLESPEPFDTTRTQGSGYIGGYYQKLIYPRNL
ncbi:MAG: hypothetical protein HY033_08045 [Ignavibacteriae bacterium]|nr:hypothetical protein [Ignavibacteria bacterium]MBI3364843.1 hypothetical protein [Ignavibacteriota bacterium]